MINKAAKTREARKYYAGMDMKFINKIMVQIESRMVNNCATLKLRNGVDIKIERLPNGKIEVTDIEPNITDQFSNENGDAMIRAIIFIIQLSKEIRK